MTSLVGSQDRKRTSDVQRESDCGTSCTCRRRSVLSMVGLQTQIAGASLHAQPGCRRSPILALSVRYTSRAVLQQNRPSQGPLQAKQTSIKKRAVTRTFCAPGSGAFASTDKSFLQT
jgi:hypothetical protein